MGLTDRAKADAKRFTSDPNGFGVEITFTAPTSEIAVVTGLHTKHHLGVDPNTGLAINSKTASVSVAEDLLIEAGYPVRNADSIVKLKGHLVSVKDSTGNIEQYIIDQWLPDEKIGLIVCILGTYKNE